MVELFRPNYPPSTKKLLKVHCKREGFKPYRFEKLSPYERRNFSQMVHKVYGYLSQDDKREILLPINNLSVSQDHNQLLFCMVSCNGKETPIHIDTQVDTNSILFKREENIVEMHNGERFFDRETGKYTASYIDSQTGEPKYFTFKDISDELE